MMSCNPKFNHDLEGDGTGEASMDGRRREMHQKAAPGERAAALDSRGIDRPPRTNREGHYLDGITQHELIWPKRAAAIHIHLVGLVDPFEEIGQPTLPQIEGKRLRVLADA